MARQMDLKLKTDKIVASIKSKKDGRNVAGAGSTQQSSTLSKNKVVNQDLHVMSEINALSASVRTSSDVNAAVTTRSPVRVTQTEMGKIGAKRRDGGIQIKKPKLIKADNKTL